MTLKLGIVGLSPGNGHPYSWSAIFNGYNRDAMESCGFPVIPRYLEQQSWPDDQIDDASVTHIWTQDSSISRHVSVATHIPNIVTSLEDMIGEVDAVLLARDDAETHYELAAPFINAGLPIYIDKPVALSLKELDRLYALQRFDGQIFTCSALRYANELHLSAEELEKLGPIRLIEASTPKDWDKYAIHIIEPLMQLVGECGEISQHQTWHEMGITRLQVLWESGIQASLAAIDAAIPISIKVIGEQSSKELIFTDTFSAFRAALCSFVEGIRQKDVRADPSFIRKTVELIELGKTK